ncbi:hypothetical protein [Ornithinibacillus bavariensis]|uniref:Uncharacterized protein n=1 Tax=Ornithinibacillus bavariensis TaxID=545502 RepID=A0A919X7S6_9BACI|nr:hypothetical protein [Ornithinibacillus bavariensis]GIO25760.1 hypothetical protein J43TS3_03710 [Ornithinibacillus bavariensis]
MKAHYIIGIIVVAIIVLVIEWKRINKSLKKEKIVMIIFLTMSIILSIALAYFPELLGPSDLVHKVFSPFGRLFKL